MRSGDVTLGEGSNGILAKIQSGCNNLRTLTTSLYRTNAIALRLDALDNPKIAIEQFSPYARSLSRYMRTARVIYGRKMERHGIGN